MDEMDTPEAVAAEEEPTPSQIVCENECEVGFDLWVLEGMLLLKCLGCCTEYEVTPGYLNGTARQEEIQ